MLLGHSIIAVTALPKKVICLVSYLNTKDRERNIVKGHLRSETKRPSPSALTSAFDCARRSGFKSLQENQRVSLDVAAGPKGKQATNIQAA